MSIKKFLTAISFFCFLTTVGCSYKAKDSTCPVGADEAPPVEAAAAIVNGKIISKSELDSHVQAYSQNMSSLGSKHAFKGAQMDENQLKEAKQKMLDQMIKEEVLYQAADNAGFSKDMDKKATEEYDRIVKQYGSEEAFANEAKKNNLTLDKVKKQIKRGLTIKGYIENEIISKTVITEEAIKTFYEQNPKYFEHPEQVKASHVLCKVPENATQEQKDAAMEKIKKVQERLKNGEKFEDIAKEVSECPSAQNGGELGFFGRGQMVKPFEDTAFALKVGEISDIVETQFGYHIIKVTDKKEAGKVPLEEVKTKIEDSLKKKELPKKIEELIKELKEKAKIEIINNEVEKKE